jgi:hypothetical protein
VQTHAFLGVYRPNGSALQHAEIASTEALWATSTGRTMIEVVETLLQTMQTMPEVQASDRELFKRNTTSPWRPYIGSSKINRIRTINPAHAQPAWFTAAPDIPSEYEVSIATSSARESVCPSFWLSGSHSLWLRQACRHIGTLDQASPEQEYTVSLGLDPIASKVIVPQGSQVKPNEPMVPLPDPNEKQYCYCNKVAGSGEVRGFGSPC